MFNDNMMSWILLSFIPKDYTHSYFICDNIFIQLEHYGLLYINYVYIHIAPSISLKGLIKEMETHGIRVGVSHHLPKDIQLLGHAIDIIRVVFSQFLQHMSSLGGND